MLIACAVNLVVTLRIFSSINSSSGRSASICARNSELNVTIETGANVLDVYVYMPLAGSENKK